MKFENDFKNLEDIDCITFSFIDHVDHDREKGIKIPPILEESYRMTLSLYDKVSNSKNKEYDAERSICCCKSYW